MKKNLLIVLAILFVPFFAKSQSFHYDTVPNPNKTNNNQGFYLEKPVEQQDQPVQPQQVAQPEGVSSGFDRSKIEVGGSLGMVFGDYTTVTIAPQIGYAFNQYLSAGVGISYNYYSYSYGSYKQSQNYLGMNLYARVRPIRYIALQVQPEGYYMWGNYSGRGGYKESESMFVPAVLVGGGAIIPAGRGGISAMIYYDVVQYKKDGINYSPYGNQLVYSVGYVFNF